MKQVKFLLLFIVAILSFLFLTTPTGATEKVILTDDKGKYQIGYRSYILEDADKSLTVEDVISKEYESKFQLVDVLVPSFGFVEPNYWLKVHVDNASSVEDWILEISYDEERKGQGTRRVN